MTSTKVIAAIIAHFPEESVLTLTAYPIPAYPNDPYPAWFVVSSQAFVYFADDVAIERYAHKETVSVRLYLYGVGI